MNAIQKGNMTVGNPLKIILLFSVPILVGNIFQQMYNVVDTAVIGHVLGDNSLAAIGATSSIYTLVIGFANGLTNGFSVVIAQIFGAADEARIRKAVSLTFVLTAILSVFLTAVSLVGIDPLLAFLNTPEEIFQEASTYLRIIMLFCVVTLFYNMLAGMLRAIGNSMVPLLALICSTIINIILDIVFVQYLSMGIAGAAYATVIAQAVSVVVCLFYISNACDLLKFKISFLVFDRLLIGNLLGTGFSMGLMLGVVFIGSVALQSAVNSFGAQTITAHIAARKIDEFLMLPLSTISTTAATFSGQNYGANRMDRVSKGIQRSLLICFVWSALACMIAFAAGKWIVMALTGTSNAEIIKTAVQYIRINSPFFFPLSVLLILRNSLQGIGRKVVPICAAVVELAAKFIGVKLIAPALGYLGVCILEPIIWVIGAIMVALNYWHVSKTMRSRST